MNGIFDAKIALGKLYDGNLGKFDNEDYISDSVVINEERYSLFIRKPTATSFTMEIHSLTTKFVFNYKGDRNQLFNLNNLYYISAISLAVDN